MNWTVQLRFQQPWPSRFDLTQRALLSLLSTPELNYLHNQRSRKRCFEFALGRALAKLLIMEVASVPASVINISLPNDQAPTIMVQNTRWYLSIAHSKGAIQVAVSDRENLGVDIQHVDKHRNLSAFISTYPALYDIQEAEFFSRWVCLEAYGKLQQISLLEVLQRAFEPPLQIRFITCADVEFCSAIATRSTETFEFIDGCQILPSSLRTLLLEAKL